MCQTESGIDCPLVDGFTLPNQPALTLPVEELRVDIYTIIGIVQFVGPNYGGQLGVATTTFTALDAGGD